MPRTAAPFKQIDVTRAVKGTLAAGLLVAHMEINRDGNIIIVVDNGSHSTVNDWD